MPLTKVQQGWDKDCAAALARIARSVNREVAHIDADNILISLLKELGYEPGEVLWCGYDLAPEVITGIQDGYGASNVDEVFNYGFLPAIALYLRAKYDFVVGDLPIATVMVTEANVEDYVYWAGQGIK